MQQQVVIELMGLLGSQSIDFTGNPIKVKSSPHSHPVIVTHIKIDNRTAVVEVDGKEQDFESIPTAVKQTIGQRLRLMLSQQKYSNTSMPHESAPDIDALGRCYSDADPGL